MCSTLDHYIQKFSSLRVDKNRNSWTSLTYNCSPYKPVLLISILDQVASGLIIRNFIEPSFELAETFQEYINSLPPTGRQASMSYPFYHLESSGFWEMIPQPGQLHLSGRPVRSVKQLRKMYLGARIDEDLFRLMQMESSREKLRMALLHTYFHPQLHAQLQSHAKVSQAARFYSAGLLGAENTANYNTTPPPPELQKQVRDQGFRKAIVQIYAHRCALCGIKMRTPEGHTIVDAAHIVPWSVSHNDEPTNGLALCKLCHWSFDKGLMSVDDDYHVMVSKAVMKDHNLPGHILTLSDRLMFRPEQSRNWPALEHFAWHRKKIFKKER